MPSRKDDGISFLRIFLSFSLLLNAHRASQLVSVVPFFLYETCSKSNYFDSPCCTLTLTIDNNRSMCIFIFTFQNGFEEVRSSPGGFEPCPDPSGQTNAVSPSRRCQNESQERSQPHQGTLMMTQLIK